MFLNVIVTGLTKAVLGCCFKNIDKWNFNYVQTLISYEEAGRYIGYSYSKDNTLKKYFFTDFGNFLSTF